MRSKPLSMLSSLWRIAMTKEERLDKALTTMDFYELAKITMEEQNES